MNRTHRKKYITTQYNFIKIGNVFIDKILY